MSSNSDSDADRRDILDLCAMRTAKPMTAINFIHGIFCYTLLADFFPNISSAVLVFTTAGAGVTIAALSTKKPFFLIPNILAKIAITIFLPLFALPLAGVDLSLNIVEGDKKLLDVALLTWLAIALICFVIEEHVMCCCFMYLLRAKLKPRRQEDNRDEPPPYSPVAISGTYGFYQSLTPPCPQYAVVCSSTSGSTSWPTA